MKEREIVSKLDGISSNYDFIYVICCFIIRDFCSALSDIGEQKKGSNFNHNEASFLIGLWIKNSTNRSKENFDVVKELEITTRLMEELHETFLENNLGTKSEFESPAQAMTRGDIFREAFFYSSSSAYDTQYIEATIQKYKYDEEYLKNEKGFELSAIKDYFQNIKKIINSRLNRSDGAFKKGITSGEYNANGLLNIFCFSDFELNKGRRDFKSITSCFLIRPENSENQHLNFIGDYNEYQAKPIIQLKDDRYFIPIPFFLAEAIYESPFYWMLGDSAYKPISETNRGVASEEMVYKMFHKIFGESNTFQRVNIMKNSTKTISDIDILGIYGDTAIIAQVKTKRLTYSSKKGNLEKIQYDFNTAVEATFLQGLKCRDAILQSNGYRFIADRDREINDLLTDVKNVYVVCFVLDGYPALTFSAQILLYEKYKESTICLSVFDLEVIGKFLPERNRFVDYITTRIDNCRFWVGENELVFLGYYLDRGLTPLPGFTGGLVDDSFGKTIDKFHYNANYPLPANTKKTKARRNDLCYCGSGLKTKFCHRK